MNKRYVSVFSKPGLLLNNNSVLFILLNNTFSVFNIYQSFWHKLNTLENYAFRRPNTQTFVFESYLTFSSVSLQTASPSQGWAKKPTSYTVAGGP